MLASALEAYDAAEAISKLELHDDEVRLVFTDVNRPGDRDGFALARETSQRWPNIKILVASGAMSPKEGDLPDGAVFIPKPFNADIVYELSQKLLPDGEKPEPLRRR